MRSWRFKLPLVLALWLGCRVSIAQVPITDAVSREFSVSNENLSALIPINNAVSREFSVVNENLLAPVPMTNAASREFSVLNENLNAQVLISNAFSREFSVLNQLSLPATLDYTQNSGTSHGWIGGVVPGFGGSTSLNSAGLCMAVPAPGQNFVLWISPERYIELLDSTVYRIKLTLSTSQTVADAIPLFFFVYDNFNASGGGNNFGGFFWVLDVDGGAEGIGRAQGRTSFDFYFTPNAVNVPQWRTQAFTPAADIENDIRLQYRVIDANASLLSDNDSGTICVATAEIVAIPRANLTFNSTVFSDSITTGTHFAGSNEDFGSAEATINNVAHTARFKLTTAGNVRRTLGPFNPTAGADFNAQLYPIMWEANTLYRSRMGIRTEVSETDPVEVIFAAMDTPTVELGMVHYTTRGAPGGAMDRAASPKLAAVEYEAYFYSQNATVSLTPNAGRLRPLGIFFNATTQGSDFTGGDALIVESLLVDKLVTPP